MNMHTYTQTNRYHVAYTYIYICTYTRIHAHTYTYACIRTRMHRQKSLATTPQRVKQHHRRTYASICICMHAHTCTHIHICAQPAASVFAHVYVGIKTHLCNIHTCPCTCAQSTCKVHAALTASWKKCTHIYTYTHTYTHTYAPENTCAYMTPSTRWSTDTETHNLCTNMHTYTHTHVYKRIDVQIHKHMHTLYTYIHVCTHTRIHIQTHTNTNTYKMYISTHACTPGTTELQPNARGAVADAGSFARLFRSTQSNHISHLQYKDFIVPTSW